MRSYGKNGRYRSLVQPQTTQLQEFSDEGESFHENTSDKAMETVTPKSSFDADAPSTGEKDTHAKEKTTGLDMFDFLDEPVRKKRKRAAQPKTDSDACEEAEYDTADAFFSSQAEQSFQSTIDDANSMLSRICGESKAKAEWESSGTQEDMGDRTPDDTDNKVMYGKNRTMLHCEDEPEITVEPPEDLRDSAEPSTHHFNHLKTMGESLKYQDDLEFMLQKEAQMTLAAKTSNLLIFALNLINNAGFLEYVIKYSRKEIWQWCLQLGNNEDPILRHLCAFIFAKLPLDADDPMWGELNLYEFVLPLTSQKSASLKIKGSKFTEMSYLEFLNATDSKPGLYYALRLWSPFLGHQKEISQTVVDTFTTLLKSRCEYSDTILPIIERLVSKETVEGHSACYKHMMQTLVPLFGSHACNDSLIKALVKMTNESALVAELKDDQKTVLLTSSLEFLLAHNRFLFDEHEDELLDIFVLYLGLTLNLVKALEQDDVVFEDKEPLIEQLKHTFQDLQAASDESTQHNFNQNIFILIYCYIAMRNKVFLQRAERAFVILRLEAFLQEIKQYNESIYSAIAVVLASDMLAS
ncbi:LAQU0S03e06612g1_1 [Lachancea quebecensis]|uniref:LAQU0S03e06612g1_1 n=1 Tax=Lachancea quebecensis TaxID=1654605 RepID=A0A0P1KNR5_9SACH|nr:LAQU0S03e06612g1_1 [Lachancea quebecensis]